MPVDLIPPRHRHICDGLSGKKRGVWWLPRIEQRIHCADGTVRRCACSRTWVAGHIPGLVPAVWRPEGMFERWWRIRKTIRDA